MSEITLSPRELLFIAAQLEATEFLGVSDAFFGMEDAEIQQEMMTIQSTLEEKGYAEMDFNGGFTLNEAVRETVDICANCDTFIVIDKNKAQEPHRRELCYAKLGRAVLLHEDKCGNTLTPINSVDGLLDSIMQGIEWQSLSDAPLQKVKIPTNTVGEAKAQLGGFDSSKGIDILVKNGCDVLSAEVIADGLSGKANYYAIIITNFESEKEGVYEVMLIDAPKGIYRMTPVSDTDGDFVLFEPLTSRQAEAAISDLVISAFPKESEGFA